MQFEPILGSASNLNIPNYWKEHFIYSKRIHLSNNCERKYSNRVTATHNNYPRGIEIVGSAVIENDKG